VGETSIATMAPKVLEGIRPLPATPCRKNASRGDSHRVRRGSIATPIRSRLRALTRPAIESINRAIELAFPAHGPILFITHGPVSNDSEGAEAMEVIIYARVSTLDQATEGVSLETQRTRAGAWALANGYEVGQAFCDAGISAKRTTNRPQLRKALEAVCGERGRVLVVYSLSRLARSTKDAIAIAEQLAKAGADLVSLTEKLDTTTAAGRMMFKMLAVLAEFERDLISERTKAALAHKASKKQRIGEIPFGKRLAGDKSTLLDDRREQGVIAEIWRLRARGLSWEAIAGELNRRRMAPKKRGAWSWQTARKIGLRNAA
jgi:site-specific DNA recombinase